MNTRAQIVGTAPPNTLVRVVVADAAPDRPNIKHQPGGKVSGSVTSDGNGQWIFVPSQQLVPGQFVASASYVGENNKVFNARTVMFVVVDSKGNSVVASVSVQQRVALGLLCFGLLLFIYIFIVVRRNGGHFASRRAEKIEHDLEETSEEIHQLRDRLAQDEAQMRARSQLPPEPIIPPEQKNK